MVGFVEESRSPLRVDELRSTILAPAGPVQRLHVTERSASTNAELVADAHAEPADWPDRSLLITEHQYQGKGRLGRIWTTPPRSSLTLSLLLRPDPATESSWGWYSLLVGLAVTTVLRTQSVAAGLKWPNDVLIAEHKVAGILGEIVHAPPHPPALVIGVGLNVNLTSDELPVPSATSLAIAGAANLDRTLLSVALVTEICRLDQRLRAHHGDADAAGLAAEVREQCLTLNRPIRVELPGRAPLTGLAETIDATGALVLTTATGSRAISAGDVHHVRPA